MPDAAEALREIVRTKCYRRLDAPIELASGATSSDFVDCKEGLARWDDLEVAARAIVEAVGGAGIDFGAVGGLTLGADAIAVAVAAVRRCSWFIVRKERKGRGTGRLIEGHQPGPGDRVLLVEDVVSTGGSVLQAHEAVVATGATVVAAATPLDRGEQATATFEALGIPYFAVTTYRDLGIDPIG